MQGSRRSSGVPEEYAICECWIENVKSGSDAEGGEPIEIGWEKAATLFSVEAELSSRTLGFITLRAS